jgi:hypothetical protein
VIEEILSLTPAEMDQKIAADEMRWGVSVMGWQRVRTQNLVL